jgi:hypothetical protein
MESELEAYKIEIERRYESSTISKGYIFPRVLIKVPAITSAVFV